MARRDEGAMGRSSGGALAPVKLTAELERELRAVSEGVSTEQRVRLRQEAFMRAREKQYGDPLATVEAVGERTGALALPRGWIERSRRGAVRPPEIAQVVYRAV